ncbi:MAG TPA: PhzF family phenazine biosynthesis protein [Candidatus Eisenbacteria bacterium]|nr:PhzF family phenazine biosynthesis protein [Candidatus Eisenbacteria bacterium]
MSRPLHIVDVFAEKPYAGNPLAVVLAADGLTDEAMQLIAAETNFSETTFVSSRPRPEGGIGVRIFTPARELAFAGHPILGTGWVVRHHLGASDPVRLDIPAGQIPVSFEDTAEGEVVWFTAPPVTFGPSCAPAAMAAALGISAEDIETRTPIQMLSSGTSAVIVPLRSLDALRRSRLDLAAYRPLTVEGFPALVYLYCRETHHSRNDLCVRFFFEAHGVREDPATGNGAAFLGAYLAKHRVYAKPDLLLRIEQGYEMQRPSLVLLRVRTSGAATEVSVGGHVVPIVRGELL